jgi:hypothetical protein
MGAGDTADAQASMVPYEGGSATSYWVVLTDHSRMPAAGAEYPMATIATYYVKPGSGTAFLDAIKKINESLAKAGGFPPAIWYALANGGEGGAYAVVTLRKNMAEMAPPSPSMREVAEKHMGKDGADATWKAFFDSVRYSTSEMMERRPDLSYQPPAR